MDKKSRPNRTGSTHLPATPSKEAPADSQPVGSGSGGLKFHVNDAGEYCIGDDCWQFRVKPGAGEVRVVVDRNECGLEADAVVDALFGEIAHGAPTVYESKSRTRK